MGNHRPWIDVVVLEPEHREIEILVRVSPARLRGDQRQRAERVTVRDQRNDHRGAHSDFVDDAKMLLVHRAGQRGRSQNLPCQFACSMRYDPG